MSLPDGLLLEISIDDDRWQTSLSNYEDLVDNSIGQIIDNVSRGRALKSFSHIELSVVLCNNALIHELNNQYRKQDQATNVLSFPGLDDDQIKDYLVKTEKPEDIPYTLGELYIAYEIMEKEASGAKISLEHHFVHLVIHGVMHLLGFDHIENEEAEIMEDIEIKLLNNLGIDDPYAA